MSALDYGRNTASPNFVLVFGERDDLDQRILQAAVSSENVGGLRRKEKVSSSRRLKVIISIILKQRFRRIDKIRTTVKLANTLAKK